MKNSTSKLVFKHPHFKRWKKRLEENGIVFKNIEVLSVISRDNIRLLVAFLDCVILTPEGDEIPRCVLIGDDSVVIVPVLTCRDDGEIYTMMVEQRRVIDGGMAFEFPAGGLEGGVDLKAVACQELQEELQLAVTPDELIPLAEDALRIDPSWSGELAYFFYFQREVSLEFLQNMDGRVTGIPEDHEHLRIKVLKMSEVANQLTSSAIIGIKLLEKSLKRIF